MNRKELFALLPDPDAIGASEYRAIHNTLVDAVNEWITREDEDVFGFTLAVLSEINEWSAKLLDTVAKERYGEKSS